MADEITVIVSLTYTKAGIAFVTRANPTSGGDSLTQKSADIRYVNRVQNIGNAAEALGLGDVVNPGFSWMKNIGDTNTISVRAGAGGADVVSLESGEWALFRFATATPFGITDAGTSDLEYFIIED